MIEELRGPQPTFKAIMEVYGKQLQIWALKKNIRPVLLDTLAAMNVTYNMFLMHCFDFSKSYNDFGFHKVHLYETKSFKTAQLEDAPLFNACTDSNVDNLWNYNFYQSPIGQTN